MIQYILQKPYNTFAGMYKNAKENEKKYSLIAA